MISDELLKIILDKTIDCPRERTSYTAFLSACYNKEAVGIILDRVPSPYCEEVRIWVNVVSRYSFLENNDDSEVSIIVKDELHNTVIFTNANASGVPIIDDHIISRYIIPLDHPLVAEHILRLEMLTL